MQSDLGFPLPPADVVTLALAGVFVCLAGLIAWRWWRKSRITPAERERQRRSKLAAHGKMGDASLVDVRDGHLFYSYDVRGVEYTASQDVTALGHVLPPDLSIAVGHIFVKYDPRNPANSVVVAEEWSGFRVNTPQR